MRKINICFFSGDISRSGGTERVTSMLVNSLINIDGYSIFILSIEVLYKERFFDFDERVIQEVLFRKKDKKSHIKIIPRLRKFIINTKIDILIDIDTILQIYSVPATRFTQTKLVAWEHFNFYENLGVKVRDFGRRLAARFSDAIVVITEEDKEYFSDNLRLKCPIYQIYNPIEISESKQKYSIDSQVIISAGRITHQKGFDILVDVAKLVFNEHPTWKWLILGEGNDRELVENKITSLNLNNHVILKGNVKDIDSFYENAAVFVLTSRYEGFGLVLTEAKSHGLPCVSFACKAGPKEIVHNNINGFLVDCFNVEQMAKKICELIENPELRRKFSDQSLYDTEKFHLENIIPKWEELINNLIIL